MAKPWQQALLSSGLPLENDLRALLAAKGCIANFEYSYLKPDEYTIEREFSYDLDASYIRGSYFINLMVECKYRHPGAKWIFAPDQYGGSDELYANDFLHVIDDFMELKFPYDNHFPRQLAPLCNKGVELLVDGANEKTVTQALSQLSYALAPQIASAIEHQVDRLLVADHIFCHVPVVATTADLYRLQDNATLNSIRSAKELEEVATREHCLVMKYFPGADLQRYNARIFNAHASKVGAKKLRSALNSHTKDLSHFYSVLANRRCPQAVVFVHIDPDQSGMEQLFAYIDELINPSKSLIEEIERDREEFAKMFASFQKSIGRKPRKGGKGAA